MFVLIALILFDLFNDAVDIPFYVYLTLIMVWFFLDGVDG